jgi:hypothetical protein
MWSWYVGGSCGWCAAPASPPCGAGSAHSSCAATRIQEEGGRGWRCCAAPTSGQHVHGPRCRGMWVNAMVGGIMMAGCCRPAQLSSTAARPVARARGQTCCAGSSRRGHCIAVAGVKQAVHGMGGGVLHEVTVCIALLATVQRLACAARAWLCMHSRRPSTAAELQRGVLLTAANCGGRAHAQHAWPDIWLHAAALHSLAPMAGAACCSVERRGGRLEGATPVPLARLLCACTWCCCRVPGSVISGSCTCPKSAGMSRRGIQTKLCVT